MGSDGRWKSQYTKFVIDYIHGWFLSQLFSSLDQTQIVFHFSLYFLLFNLFNLSTYVTVTDSH